MKPRLSALSDRSGLCHRRPADIRQEFTLKTLLTGFNFVFTNRIILGIITLDMSAVLLGGATALLPIYAKDLLFVGPLGLGLLQAALPLGAISCAFVIAHRTPIQKAGRALPWAVTVFGVATMAFGCSRWFWLSFLMLFTCVAADNVSVVVHHILVQLLTPNEKQGRVSAVNNLFIGSSNELGEFESGTVAHWFGRPSGKASRRERSFPWWWAESAPSSPSSPATGSGRRSENTAGSIQLSFAAISSPKATAS